MTVRFKRRRMLEKLNKAIYIGIFSFFAILFWFNASGKADNCLLIESETVSKEVAKISASSKSMVTTVQITEDDGEISTQQNETAEDTEASEYDGLFMVNVDDYLSVRADAASDAEIIGKLYAGSGGTVIEEGEDWTKITSGNLTGYVATKYICIGKDAEMFFKENAVYIATVKADSLRIRKEADENSDIIGLAAQGETLTCIKTGDEWTKVTFDGGTGYVSSKYIEVKISYNEAISIEEEAAAAEEAAQLQQSDEMPDEQSEYSTEVLQEEDTQIQQEQQVVNYTDDSQSAGSEETIEAQNSVAEVSYDDAYLLACIVYCEAGSESYEGKLAVANVVINRLNSGKYGNSISSVIYAKGQFGPATNGSLDAVLSSGPDAESVTAANAALSGTNNIGGYMSFGPESSINATSLTSYIIIGNHIFY
ncbi:MAG: SH3 domain-containing protein [Eubacterium sp.]